MGAPSPHPAEVHCIMDLARAAGARYLTLRSCTSLPPMTTEKPSPAFVGSRLLGIQTARGVAAVLVVLYHAGRGIALPQYAGRIAFGGLFNFGHAGVDFFFVLSGFIIYAVHHRDIGVPAAVGRYVRRRLTRILPIYWVVTALVLLLAVMRPDGAQLPDAWHLLASLLLLPQAADPVLGVAWTLVFEMTFYALFALAIVSCRLGAGVLLAWLALILAGMVTSLPGALLGVLASPLNLEFMLGVAVARTTFSGAVPRPLLLAAAGALAFLAAGMIENAALMTKAGGASEALFGLASAAMIAGLATAERQGRLRIGPAGAFLGDASYALYLMHTVVIGLAARVLGVLGLVKALPVEAVFAVVVAAAVLAGAALHVLVERRLLRWLGGLGRGAPAGVAKARPLPTGP
jgi:exopolysaccharide production protein ExoZ